MKLIYNSIFLEHDTGMHPENSKRLSSFSKLKNCKLENAEQYLTYFHKPEYIKKIKQIALAGGGRLDNDTVASDKSYAVAVNAVAATLLASEIGGFALVRPPGHHAHPNHSSGFCIFNNISIAAQKHVLKGKKVLIFDFDGHLGDGTSKYFYDSDKVLYWSFHQYPAFPGRGTVDEIGSGNGKGYTINVPLSPKSGDDLFFRGLTELLPVAIQFNPDIVAVSAGFDAHQDDLLLDLRLSTTAYYNIGKILRKNFKNIFATLEGGYNLDTLPKCIDNFLLGINGKPIKHKDLTTDSSVPLIEEFEIKLQKLKNLLGNYWRF